jgi:hypothetical protein
VLTQNLRDPTFPLRGSFSKQTFRLAVRVGRVAKRLYEEVVALPAIMLGVFAVTLFMSALLLFLVELMVGKLMLPLLGGTPAVWNTCMVFFQAVLLAGYAYAHYTTRYLTPRRQAYMHLVVLVLPLIFFAVNGPLTIQPWLIQGRENSPIFALLLVLTVCVGLPMFVVCTSAPLLTRWFSATDHPASQDPYFLYAASNFGSMLALAAYPTFVESNFTLNEQRLYWCIGFGVLAALTAACAFLMWASNPPSPQMVAGTPLPREATVPGSTQISDRPTATASIGPEDRGPGPTVGKPVTNLRMLRWLILAAVPSSLMLGATTYMSMDIAAIPLLWVLPLMLYLLTFIIVFSVFSVRFQNIVVAVSLWVLLIGLGLLVAPENIKESVSTAVDNWTGLNIDPYIGTKWFEEGSSILLLIRLGVLGAMIWAGWIFTLKDKELIHHVMVMVMPLLILLLMFMMYAEVTASIWVKIALHLATLFIAAMVCHGELARDRPEPEHLTNFFLIMSIGGVVGGMFNSLAAPVLFNSYIEYQIAMMVACCLVPPLGVARESKSARMADLALCATFFLVSLILFLAFYSGFFPGEGKESTFPETADLPWEHWTRAFYLFIPGIVFAILAATLGWSTPPVEEGEVPQNHYLDRMLDVLLPLGLFFLVLGLFWGLPSPALSGKIKSLAEVLKLENEQFRNILIFGLPAVLCYTFVERNIRFGLGVGAIMLASGMSLAIQEGAMYQDRSFFGVLKVEDSFARYPEDRSYPAEAYFAVHRLVHGTTLHGKQFLEKELRNLPSSYYHASGPVGMLVRNYNRDPKRNLAVIGLGTGTVAAYALPGQRLDYYDIDPVVVDIAFDQSRFFTYIEDAEDRGVDVGLILGDARLTIDPNNPLNRDPDPSKHGVARLKPLRKKYDEETRMYERPFPERKFGKRLMADDKYGIIFADAFSSDAIPVHLITKEAVSIYLRRLLEDGVVCIHISNRYLDLEPVLANITSDLRKNGIRDEKGNLIEEVPNLVCYGMSDDDEMAPGKSRSNWVVITRDIKNISKLLEVPLWTTDDAQLAGLGLALWPAPSAGHQAATSMGLLVRGIAEEATRRARKDEDPSFDAPRTRKVKTPDGQETEVYALLASQPKWLPLDTLYDLDERHAADIQEKARLEPEVQRLSDKSTEVDMLLKAATKELEPLKAEFEAASANVDTLNDILTKATPSTDKADVMKKLADAKRKLEEVRPKYEAQSEKVEELKAAKEWWTLRRQVVRVQLNRVERRIDRIDRRRKSLARVGVWSDDFSNLLSVFNR